MFSVDKKLGKTKLYSTALYDVVRKKCGRVESPLLTFISYIINNMFKNKNPISKFIRNLSFHTY